ncbi:MAG: hypothetical protein DRQ59_13445 [Gammaproteobacteria bacterium]|nr:MAG: hypothetical protein DRQ59_13445 [Gammaproteobacteria bacterium]
MLISICIAVYLPLFKTESENETYINIFGGYITIPGEYYVDLGKLDEQVLVLSPRVASDYRPPHSTLRYFIGNGDEERVLNTIRWFIEKLNLVEDGRSDYKGYLITKFKKAERKNFYDSLTIEMVVTILKIINF